MGILSFSGIAAVIFNLVTWGSPYEYLPLHLCSLTAMVLPVAVFPRSKVLGNLLLLWSLGAVMALFWTWIPCPGWYMLPVVFIVLVYLGFIYLKQIIACFKKKAAVKSK